MKALRDLVALLEQDEEVIAFRALEEALLNHPKQKEAYQALLKQQKKLVHAEVFRDQTLDQTKTHYDNTLEALTSNPFIQNYLEHQESLNLMLQWITSTIEAALEERINEALKMP